MKALGSRVFCLIFILLYQSHSQAQTQISRNEFTLEVGKTYAYEYSVSTELLIALSTNLTVLDQIKGSVKLSLQDNGVYKIELIDPENTHATIPSKDANCSNTITESSDDGPSCQPEFWKSNLRHAIVSHFYITAKSLEVPSYITETDISGECLTEYIPQKLSSSVTKLVKRKYTAGCNKRFTYRSSLRSYSVQPPTRAQKISFVDGILVCTQYLEIGKGLLNSTCEEILKISSDTVFRGQTEMAIRVNLNLIEVVDGDDEIKTPEYINPVGLDLERLSHKSNYLQNKKEDIASELQMFEQISNKSSPRLVYKAIQMLRHLDTKQHSALLTEVLQNESSDIKKIYTSTMILTGTVRSFSILLENTEKMQLSVHDILRALSNIETPSVELLPYLEKLMDRYQQEDIALPVSEAVYRVCQECKICAHDAHFQSIVEHFRKSFRENCGYGDYNEMQKVIVTLRALGNIYGFANSSDAIDLLENCLENANLDVSVRAAAIESVRLMTCDNDLDTILWKYLHDPMTDIELRINAYRLYMKCPSDSKLRSIINMMHSEVSQQFGSFVFSHLTNLVNLDGLTGRPWASHMGPYEKEILMLGKTFRLNRRSYSKHYGRFFRIGNGGLNVESFVIFGPESPVPRHVSLNVTLELFGSETNLMEFGLRTTEQSRIFKRLLGRKPTASIGKLDEMETLIKTRQGLAKFTSVFVRICGQERLYVKDIFKAVMGVFKNTVKRSQTMPNNERFTVENRVLMDSSLLVPTIGGFPVEINYLSLTTSQNGAENQFEISSNSGRVNWTSSTSMTFGRTVKVKSYGKQVTINQWHQATFDSCIHGLIQLTNTPEQNEWRIYLQDWQDGRLAFNFKQESYSIVGGKLIEDRPESENNSVVSQTPAFINTLLGLSASSKITLMGNNSGLLPAHINLRVNYFHGLDARFVLERGNTWLGRVRRLYILFMRPGESKSLETTNHFEISLNVGRVNQTVQYVQLRFFAPWKHDLEIHAEYNENGILLANGTTSGTPWNIYGAYTEAAVQQKFTAKLSYPNGRALLVFRGNLTGNFKLQVYSPDESWPAQFQVTQRSIVSRHTHYPSFKRIHEDAQLRLRDNQSVSLQLEWNTGRRNGRLEQGVIRLSKLTDAGPLEMQTSITWKEGEQPSRLDYKVHGYARQITLETKLIQTGDETFSFAMGADQFLSKNFWMLHSDNPAVASLHAWTFSPSLPNLQLNFTTACMFRYRLDRGGIVNASTNLIIPHEHIDALAQGTLEWKSDRKAGNPWIRDSSGSITLRIFPPHFDRYFRVNFTHAITNDVISVASVEFDSRTVYMVESTLYRGQPVHTLRLRWPPGRELLINTTYRLQLGRETEIAFTNAIADTNHKLIGFIQTDFLYEMATGRVMFRHNSTRFDTDGEPRQIVGFEWGSELYGVVKTNPFQLDFRAAGLLQIQIPLLNVDGRLEVVLSNHVGLNRILMQARCLYIRPLSQNKYGIDFNCDLDTRSAKIFHTNLDFYLSGGFSRSSGCDFKYNSSHLSRLIALECSKENVGILVFHEKFRHLDGLKNEGSHMLSIIPSHPSERFKGWYSNCNYAVARLPSGFSMDLRGEFTPNSGTGPGTPLRLYLQFTHDEMYRTGSLETVFNSQHIGYWTGYEMVTTLSRYELTGPDSSDQQWKFTLRSILGVRLLEGRGTRAFEGGLQFILSPSGDHFSGLVRAGHPGMTGENELRFQYSLYPMETNISLELTLLNAKELFVQSALYYEPKYALDAVTMEVAIPRFDVSGNVNLTRDGPQVKVTAVSQNQTIADDLMQLSEYSNNENDQNVSTISSIKGNMSVFDGSQTSVIPVSFTAHLTHAGENGTLKSIETSLDFRNEGDVSQISAGFWVHLPSDKDSIYQVGMKTTYPWHLKANIWFGQQCGRYVYRHQVERLSKQNEMGWNAEANCSLQTALRTNCSMSYSNPKRTVDVIFDTNPLGGSHLLKVAWDKNNNGFLQAQLNDHGQQRSIAISTPLREVRMQIVRQNMQQSNSSRYEETECTFQSRDPDDLQGARNANLGVVFYELVENDIERQSWTYGTRLRSNMLYEDSIESNLTIQHESNKMELKAMFSAGSKQDHNLRVQLSADETQNDTVNSEVELNRMGKEYQLLGRHQLQRSYMSSDIRTVDRISWINLSHWNLTIDPWSVFQLTNHNDTEITQHIWRNGTHGNMRHRLFVSGGLIDMSQLTSLAISPTELNTMLSSTKGKAWIAGHKTGPKEFLLEMEHQSNPNDLSQDRRRKDLVARVLIDPSNTIHANLNWRPGLINEFLLYGTEITDMDHMHEFLVNHCPGKLLKDILMQLFTDHVSKSFVDHSKLKKWTTVAVNDLQSVPNTLADWWEKDCFYVKSLNVPVIRALALFNVSEFVENVTKTGEVLVDEIKNIIIGTNNEIEIGVGQMKAIMLNVEREKFPLFRPTFEAIAEVTNRTLWATKQFANFLFYKVAACTNAVNTLQSSLNNWIGHQHVWLSQLGQTRFVAALGKFFTQLQEDIPPLKPMGSFTKSIADSVMSLLTQTMHYCKRLVSETTTGKELRDLLTLMAAGKYENASNLFFKPHLSQFTVDLNHGLVQLSTHIPVLFERVTEMLTSPHSYPRQVLSWLYPGRGMKSIMYAYDQYQRNFDAMRKLTHLIPPYKVTAWLMIDRQNNGFLITFNGLFIPIQKPHSGPYFLLGDHNSGRTLRIVHQFDNDDGWYCNVTIADVAFTIHSQGRTILTVANSEKPVCLPLSHLIEPSMWLRVTRSDDRITLRLHSEDRFNSLFIMVLDLRLRQIRYELDGTWHGQCRGLLGSNTFDQLHELIGPRTGLIRNQTVLSREWSYETKTALNEDVDLNNSINPRFKINQSHALCQSMWQKFSQCFTEVPPIPWIQACAFDGQGTEPVTNSSRFEWDRQTCTVARTYVQSCNNHDVLMRVPHQCVNCISDDSIDNRTLATSRRLTFVLELDACLTIRLKEIYELLGLLIKSKEATQFQYSAITFTTVLESTESTQLTSDNGDIWMDGKQFRKTLETFITQQTTTESVELPQFVEWPRAIEALKKAIRQPAASSTLQDCVLLFTCNGCISDGSQYKTLVRVMKRKGLDFHYLPYTSFTTAGDLNQRVFLLTSEGQHDELDPDGLVKRSVNIGTVNPPRDHCSLIAQESGGYIWAYQKVVTNKQRLRAVVASLSNHLTKKGEIKRQCVCRDNLYGSGILDCSIATGKETTKFSNLNPSYDTKRPTMITEN